MWPYLTKTTSQNLKQAREECTAQLNRLRTALSTLEILGTEMADLVEQQQSIEVDQIFVL